MSGHVMVGRLTNADAVYWRRR